MDKQKTSYTTSHPKPADRRRYTCTKLRTALSTPGARAVAAGGAERCVGAGVAPTPSSANRGRSGFAGDQAHLPCPAQRLGPVARPELGEQVAQVKAHSVGA